MTARCQKRTMNRMRYNAREKLTVDLVVRAINKDSDALKEMVNIYQPYIIELCKYRVKDRNGNVVTLVDREMKFDLEQKLMEELADFNPFI